MKVSTLLSLVSLQIIAVASLPIDVASEAVLPDLLVRAKGNNNGGNANGGGGKNNAAAQQKAVMNAASSFANDVATVSSSLNKRE